MMMRRRERERRLPRPLHNNNTNRSRERFAKCHVNPSSARQVPNELQGGDNQTTSVMGGKEDNESRRGALASTAHEVPTFCSGVQGADIPTLHNDKDIPTTPSASPATPSTEESIKAAAAASVAADKKSPPLVGYSSTMTAPPSPPNGPSTASIANAIHAKVVPPGVSLVLPPAPRPQSFRMHLAQPGLLKTPKSDQNANNRGRPTAQRSTSTSSSAAAKPKPFQSDKRRSKAAPGCAASAVRFNEVVRVRFIPTRLEMAAEGTLQEIYWSSDDFIRFRTDFLQRARAAGVLAHDSGARMLCVGPAALWQTTAAGNSEEEAGPHLESTTPSWDDSSDDRDGRRSGDGGGGADPQGGGGQLLALEDSENANVSGGPAVRAMEGEDPVSGGGAKAGGGDEVPSATDTADVRSSRSFSDPSRGTKASVFPGGDGPNRGDRIGAPAASSRSGSSGGAGDVNVFKVPVYRVTRNTNHVDERHLENNEQQQQQQQHKNGGLVAVVYPRESLVPRSSIIDHSGRFGKKVDTSNGSIVGGAGGGGPFEGGWFRIFMPWEWNRPCATTLESNA